MLEEFKKEFTPFKFLVVLLIIAVSIYLLQILFQILGNFSDIILIVIVAWLMSFVLEAPVNLISRVFQLGKVWSALVVYLILGAFLLILIFNFIPIVSVQLQTLSKIVPGYFTAFPQIENTWNNAVRNSIDTLIYFIPSIAYVFLDIILILFLSFYLIVDKDTINEEFYKLTPVGWHKNLKFIQGVVDITFSSFLRIQIIFGIIAAITTWIVLTIFRINFAASIALLSGLLTIIPLVGPILALIPPVFVALILSPNDPTIAIIIFTILLLIQQVTFNFVGPKLMEKAFKLHPIIVLLSILVGFKIAGPLGAVFIVPILGVLVIVFKELGHYFINPPHSSDKK